MPTPKRIVYILGRRSDPTHYYTGVTADLRARLDDHNARRCPHTAKARPWAVDVIVKFADERRAVAFERYLSRAPAARSRSGTSGDASDLSSAGAGPVTFSQSERR